MLNKPKMTLRRWLYENNDYLLRQFYHSCEELHENESPRTLLEVSAPELKDITQRLLWKARDYLHALKDPKCNLQEGSDYITQLKDYISIAQTLLDNIEGRHNHV